jgi:DNA polymerase-3 subunit alpha
MDFCQRVDAHKLNKRVLEALIYSGALDALAPNRASLMAQLPEVMKAAEQQARDSQAGQHDIFGNSSRSTSTSQLAVVEEWPLQQRLIGERETLGHYLSGHPADAFRDVLVQLVNCPLGEIDKHYRPPPPGERRGRFNGQPFVIAGQLVSLRKRGDTMAFAQIEDSTGRIEASFFRETFVEFGAMLTRDAILVIEGGLLLDEFSGGFQLRARRVQTLNDACEKSARLLRLKLNGVDAGFAARLRGALASHRGGRTAMRLTYANAEGHAEIELGADWRVRATADLKQALESLPGVLSAELVLNRPTPSAA